MLFLFNESGFFELPLYIEEILLRICPETVAWGMRVCLTQMAARRTAGRTTRRADDLGYGREDLGEGGSDEAGRYSWTRNGPSASV